MNTLNEQVYRAIQDFPIDEYNATPKQRQEVCRILDICKDFTLNSGLDDLHNIPKGSKWNNDLGNACRNASIGAIWTMINLIRHIYDNDIEEGDKGFTANAEVVDHKRINKILADSITKVAELVATSQVDFNTALTESAYKRKKVSAQDCWHIGNAWAEVMGVKVPDPNYWKQNKKANAFNQIYSNAV